MGDFFRRLRYYFRRDKFEAELEEEMRHHAKLAGKPKFGNVTLLKEDSRAMWTWTFWEQLSQDLRYALRTMAGNKAFTALAALSLALGIGANTAIYSFMDSILLRSLPVQEPRSLVMLRWRSQPRTAPGQAKGKQAKREFVMHGIMSTSGSNYNDPKTGFNGGIFPYPAFELFQKHDAVFSSVFGYWAALGTLNLAVNGQAEVARGVYVSGEYFRGLGVPPAAGRLIAADDDKAGAPAVAILSYAFSQRRFGGEVNAVGQSILVDNTPFSVIGVTPPEFLGTDPQNAPDCYLPMHALLLQSGPFPWAAEYQDPNLYWMDVMARLRPGVSLEQAQSNLTPQFQQWVSSTARNDGERADLPKLVIQEGGGGLDALRRQYSKPLYVLLTLVGLILAIACANIANLLLARATVRQREMAVRLSMGAGRWRVIRQLLTESVLLASLGGALGIVFAVWGIRFLTLLLANGRENFTLHAELNWHVLGVTLALSVLTGVLFGLAPAIQSTRVDVIPALKEARAGERVRRSLLHVNLSQALVVSQIAISLLMLEAAGLFLHTLVNLQTVELGFNRENLLLFQLNARQAGHKDPEISTFYADLRKRFSTIPGVRGAAFSMVPLIGGGSLGTMLLKTDGVQQPFTLFLPVGPAFFTTMQIPMLLGREIDDRDQPRSQAVAVVNELFAKTYFGTEDPVGRHISIGRDLEIVGVSKVARYADLKQDNQPVVYVAYNQGDPMDQMVYELRTAGDPLAYVSTVREIVHQTEPRVPLSDVKTQATQIDQTINQEIIFARLCTGFAILGLAIACVGLYGTMSYSVARRTNEIGIRMALGAQRGGVVWMMLRQVCAMAAIGLAIWLPTALATSKFVESFLFGMKPDDPLAIAAAVTALVAAAVIAGYAPARRASKIDPIVALRHE